MKGLPQLDTGGWTCPECGQTTITERALFRRRRHLGRAVVALLLSAILFYGHTVYERRDEGWPAFMPTTLAIALYQRDIRHDQTVSRFAWRTLYHRYMNKTMGEWQYRMLVWRVVDDSEDAIWESVRLPETWIRGRPIPIGVDRPSFGGGLLSTGVSVTQPEMRGGVGNSSWSGFEGLMCRLTMMPTERELPAVDAELVEVPVTITAWARSPDGAPFDSKFDREYRRTFQIRLLPNDQASRDQIAQPIQNAKADARLIKALRFQVGLNGYGTLIVYDSSLAPFQDSNPYDFAFHYDAEVRDGNQSIWRESCGPGYVSGRYYASEEENEALFERLSKPGSQWHAGNLVLRLTPRQDLAMTDLGCTRYWVPADGSPFIEVPLAEVLYELEFRGGGQIVSTKIVVD